MCVCVCRYTCAHAHVMHFTQLETTTVLLTTRCFDCGFYNKPTNEQTNFQIKNRPTRLEKCTFDMRWRWPSKGRGLAGPGGKGNGDRFARHRKTSHSDKDTVTNTRIVVESNGNIIHNKPSRSELRHRLKQTFAAKELEDDSARRQLWQYCSMPRRVLVIRG